MLDTMTVCCLTRNVFPSAEQLLKTDTLYSLQAVMAVGDMILYPEPRNRLLTLDGMEWWLL